MTDKIINCTIFIFIYIPNLIINNQFLCKLDRQNRIIIINNTLLIANNIKSDILNDTTLYIEYLTDIYILT